MGFITPIICDRRTFNEKGKWKSPNNDLEENIFYFIKEHTYVPSYVNGNEQLKETYVIVVFGSKAFAKEDDITLADGTKLKVESFSPNYLERNPLVMDLLKPRVGSVELTLEQEDYGI